MATATYDPNAPSTEARHATPAMIGMAGPLLVVGALLLLAAAGLAYSAGSMARFWHVYLQNAVFAATVSLGGLFFVLAHHLTGGRWGATLRRLSEVIGGTIGVTALLFIPVVALVATGGDALYYWNNSEAVAADPVLSAKAPYLNGKWFVIRQVVYFALWTLIARWYLSTSVRQDQSGDVAALQSMQRWSGPAMALFALSLSFASYDWLMSLDPIWFSTMFGVYFWAGCAIAFYATLILLAGYLQRRGVLTESIRTEHFHDASKLLFAMVVFWGYVAFSQFMLIWYANIPEETAWYASRSPEGSTDLGISTQTALLFVFHLFVPFLGFMSKRVRRSRAAMSFWALYMLVAHWFDLYYIVMPTLELTYRHTGAQAGTVLPGLLEPLCAAGAVCVLLGALARGAAGKALTPIADPRRRQAMTYVNP